MNKNKFGKISISLILSIILFVGLLILERNITSPNGTVQVWLSTNEIEEGTIITEENKDDFFEKITVDGKLSVENAIKSSDELIDTIANTEMKKGEVMVGSRFADKKDLLGKIKNPVETSIRVSDVSQIVGGILREGDIIDISVINSTTNENEEVLKNVYVKKAFSSDGKEIDRVSDLSALTVNLIMSEEDEAKLNGKIALGTIRIRKIK